MAEAGFEIEGRHYPFVSSFRFGDTVLVTNVTGLSWDEFTDALSDPESKTDPVIMLGTVAVAVWQGNPRWTRDRVVRYVEALDITSVVPVAGDDDAVPPSEPPETAAQTLNDSGDVNGDASTATATKQNESVA